MRTPARTKSFSPIGHLRCVGEDQKFIYVAHNYRLGMPGWAYVPGLDMDANVRLHDCPAAGEWVAEYIDRFGGDLKKVTAIGQSAGTGILQLLTTWKGGRGRLPFQQPFLPSAAYPH
ncbi:hypothetical protein VTK56DRAFT_772 [Thermocarpiscus australiensis]